ncbi:MAG: hypothetical protein Kow0069_38600 [Promethearchaeota archaeon]
MIDSQMVETNFQDLIRGIKEDLNVPMEMAIINRYGIVLGSTVDALVTGSMVPPSTWQAIEARNGMVKELKTEAVRSIIVTSSDAHWAFVFGESFIFATTVPFETNVSKIIPVLETLVMKLDQATGEERVQKFAEFDFEKECGILLDEMEQVASKKRYKIIKHLIKHISK